MDLKESEEGYVGGFGGRKGKRNIIKLKSQKLKRSGFVVFMFQRVVCH